MRTWANSGYWALLAWGLGVAVQLQQAQLLATPVYAMVALTAVVLVAVAPWPLWRWLAVGAAAWALTGWHAAVKPSPMAPELEGRDLDVVGVVQAMPQRQDVGWRFRFRIEQAHWRGQAVQTPPQVYLGWYGASSQDDPMAASSHPVSEPVQAGQRWRWRVRLKAAHGHLNPRGFDYELWLWEQGIRATGYVRQARGDPAPQLLGQTWAHPVEWARQRVRERMLARWPLGGEKQNIGGILAALVTGDQAAIERSDWDVFRATGVSHLMSISGVHVTLLGWGVGLVAAACWRRSARWGSTGPVHWPAPVVGAWLGWALAGAYALFSGWGVPAQRTVWMLTVVTLLSRSARDWPWPWVWGVSAAVVLALDPWAMLQPGFWLSFVAVGVLLASGQRSAKVPPGPLTEPAVPAQSLLARCVQRIHWRSWGGRGLLHLRGLLREQALITLALLPLSLLFFGQFSLVGLLANLVAIPWVTLWVTPLALLGVVLPGAWTLADVGLQPLLWLLQGLSTWQWASVSLAMPPWPVAAVALLGAMLMVLRGPWAWRVLGVPLLMPALLWQPPRPAWGQFELLALDVGQGNAVLLRTAGHSLLYDAGPRYSPENDAGHRVLLPLLAQSKEKLDLLMLSHRDSDHTGGAQAVLDMQPQARLWSSLEDSHPLNRRPQTGPCAAGQRWVWDGVVFEVLHPLPGAQARQPNALSCVLRVQGHSGSALLAGDVEAAQEADLLARGLAPVDVLLVPHHGSKTSSSAVFLDALQPRLALVQAGYRNRFGHPAPEVLQRYRDRDIAVFDSVHCGAATWQSKQPARVRCERQVSQRYWHHAP